MSSNSDIVPPSPRRILQHPVTLTPSFALSDAISGFASFASLSAASFSAVTAPSAFAPRTSSTSSTSSASSTHSQPETRRRYNLRSSSRSDDKENHLPPDESSGRNDARNRHHRHAVPETVSQTLTKARSNARLTRLIRKSTQEDSDDAPDKNAAVADSLSALTVDNPTTIETRCTAGKELASESPSPPLLASTPSRSNSSNLLRACLETSARRSGGRGQQGGSGYDFTASSGWLSARNNHGSKSSTITIGSSISSSSSLTPSSQNNLRFDRSADDSVIVLDDTREEDDDDNDSGEVFRFTAPLHGADDKNDDSNNDSVVVLSPPGQQDDENAAELMDEPENLDDSVCMTRHKIVRVCPITKLAFQKPVKNVCGHVYEKSAIYAMNDARIRRGRFILRCPVPGCQRLVFANHLEAV